jgi:hypothetical protein
MEQRKSNDAEIESLREEYHQRVATLERKVCFPFNFVCLFVYVYVCDFVQRGINPVKIQGSWLKIHFKI